MRAFLSFGPCQSFSEVSIRVVNIMSLKHIITSLFALTGNIVNDVEKGLSKLGTVPTVPLPASLGDKGGSWSSIDPGSQTPPKTGNTVKYDWTITRDHIAPDGYNRTAILINGQFPGPLLEANWGDTVQVTVHNQIDTEGVTLHWHGLTQKETIWYDGVPGVSQCPVAPGSSFTYTFIADQYGTSWYHSHYSAQYTDGLFGPMVIYGPKTDEYDIDLGPIILEDFFHTSYFEQNEEVFVKPPAGPIFATVDNNLINGKGLTLECGSGSEYGGECNTYGALAKFNFTTGKTHRLRLINAGSGGTQYFRIDNHNITVIANDFVPVKPYAVDYVTLAIGQRADILVTATGKDGDAVWMRSDVDPTCSTYNTTNQAALAPIYYPKANRTSVPQTKDSGYAIGDCGNDALAMTVPKYPQPVLAPSTTSVLEITAGLNQTGNLVFMVNGSQFEVNYNTPILNAESQGERTFPVTRNVFNFGSNDTVRLIVKNAFPQTHPMHMHGHNFQVLATGTGDWDGTIVNPQNPQRRDTQALIPGSPEVPSFIVLQYAQDKDRKSVV